jgi:hypothetical protein
MWTSLFWIVIGAGPVRLQLNNSVTVEDSILMLEWEETPESLKGPSVSVVLPHLATPSMTVNEFKARLQVEIPHKLITLLPLQFQNVRRG